MLSLTLAMTDIGGATYLAPPFGTTTSPEQFTPTDAILRDFALEGPPEASSRSNAWATAVPRVVAIEAALAIRNLLHCTGFTYNADQGFACSKTNVTDLSAFLAAQTATTCDGIAAVMVMNALSSDVAGEVNIMEIELRR